MLGTSRAGSAPGGPTESWPGSCSCRAGPCCRSSSASAAAAAPASAAPSSGGGASPCCLGTTVGSSQCRARKHTGTQTQTHTIWLVRACVRACVRA